MLAYGLIQKCWPGWELKTKIGHGDFGEVYEIVDTANPGSGSCVVKIIRYSEETEQENVEDLVLSTLNATRMMERARISGYVVDLYDYQIVEEEDPYCWNIALRMEKLESLSDYRKRHTLTEKEILDLGIDISKALSICHANNIIHGNIKETNLFRSPHGNYKIGGFGISQHIENTQASSYRQGAMNYMAPEIYRGERYGYDVDTYALGLVLYRLFNRGRIPFLQNDDPREAEEANRRRLSGEILPPPVEAGPELAAIIEKACHPDPKERYQSADEFKEALIRERYAGVLRNTSYEKEQTTMNAQEKTKNDRQKETDTQTQTETEVGLPEGQTAQFRSEEKTEATYEHAGRAYDLSKIGGALAKGYRWIKGFIKKEQQFYDNGTLFIEGEDQDGELNGYGKVYDENGELQEEGEYKDGKLNGYGKVYCENGELCEEGEFKDGELNGQGKVYLVGDLWLEGMFKDGEFNGYGKIYDVVGGELCEEGEFKDGKLNGQGKTYFIGELQEEGMFKDGELNGQGKRYHNGELFEEGMFKDGKLHGQGKKYSSEDGRLFEGEFKDGELYNGIEHLASGEVIEYEAGKKK